MYNLERQQSFVTLAMRDMLTNAGTYDEAVEYLSKIPLIAPCYYILAGSQSGQVRRSFLSLKMLSYSLLTKRVWSLLDHVKHLWILQH